jgi:hypothetical protein
VARSTVLHRNTSSARNLSLIDMAEGFSVQCTVNGCAPDKVQPGARVRLSATADQTGPELVFELCDSPLRDRRY